MPEAAQDAQDGQQDQQASQEDSEQQSSAPAPKMYSEDYVKELRAEAAKNRTAARAAMSDTERAVHEAEERGRTAAIGQYGQRLARAEFDSLAGRRNPTVKTADVLEFVDLSRFVKDDGEPDSKAIQAAVDRLVPEAQAGPPSFDGGARESSAKSGDMNTVIRKMAGL